MSGIEYSSKKGLQEKAIVPFKLLDSTFIHYFFSKTVSNKAKISNSFCSRGQCY